MECLGETMQERVDAVLARIAAACRRAGRARDAVRLVAVAKTYGPEAVAEAARCGLDSMGESRIQEARQKIPLCPSGLSWHMIGHLQRNKVREAVRLFDRFHAIDSLALLERLEAMADEAGRRVAACLEVNVSGESAKYGLAPEAVPAVLEAAAGLRRVEVTGLMTIPPFHPEPEAARPYFRRLRELRDTWAAGSGLALEDLSMGMSGDFEVAIEEGATWVRVGSALFGPRAPRRRPGPEEGESCV